MRKLFAALMLFSMMSTSAAFAEEDNVQTSTYSFYVVSQSPAGHDYWAVTQDGQKNLWFTENDVKGELLQENDTFKATFDNQGKLLSIEKYTLQ